MVDFGSEQGLSDFETAGIARYFEDFKRAKTKLWAKRCRLWMDTSWYLTTLACARHGRQLNIRGPMAIVRFDAKQTPYDNWS
ncbi:MAG: hypothetical protein U9N83_03590 [Thermodesulfobacteriota bacterium]|nr:hypothetical protein [Thermodesulfobacteriota bacterium]